MKRKTEEKIKRLAKAGKDLEKILEDYTKQTNASQTLTDDLLEVLRGYETDVFKAIIGEQGQEPRTLKGG